MCVCVYYILIRCKIEYVFIRMFKNVLQNMLKFKKKTGKFMILNILSNHEELIF